ncbi:spermidine/putrescine ABC transporter substrate-binding protein [Planomonospora sp. ID67723]|uniref:ABC transporter substrate-binding protein n=1 Tax=Planomonospora sp. ID67723 TaxID=2738134 RepID=UPI0018C3AA78|nr:spermidine/putrescine ABC transporter substrate-binding protein [Planomonospora sp. ID67723]MBG0828606.1 spermidine/putrescine ABC transporter substrate-binding protein [Planomonospora sp. ID67723]
MNTPHNSPFIDPAFLRGMTRSRAASRRDVFRLAGLTAAGLALSACGVQGQKKAAPKPSEVAGFWSGKQKNGKVVFANWPEYMPEDRGPLKKFQQETGIAFEYLEVIEENASFFGKSEPQLRAGQPLGYDIVVMTNGMQFARMQALGYLVALDHKQLPNFAANAAPKYKNPAYDPNNTYSIPYTSGLTGIAYNTKYVKEPITSIQALFDPKYKGKVGMMADSQEIANFGLFALGIEPEKATKADWEKAAAKLKEQRDGGIVRKYYDQDYIDAVSKGDVWLTMGWSGDVFQRQLAGEPVAFVVPEEGGTIWTDNMMIPKGAANPVDALMLMDFLYRSEVAAELTEYIQYVTPVPAVKDLLTAKAAGLKGEDKKALEAMVESPLVFPSEADYTKLHGYVSPAQPADQEAFQGMFQAVTQG